MARDLPLVLTSARASGWLWPTVVLGLLGLFGLGVLYLFAPTEYAFYPRCALYQFTGLHCPGCGSLRALHALLHGNIAEAVHSNSLLVLSLPAAALAWIWHRRRRQRGLPPLPAFWWWAVISIYILFGLLRNIPWEPFVYLAP